MATFDDSPRLKCRPGAARMFTTGDRLEDFAPCPPGSLDGRRRRRPSGGRGSTSPTAFASDNVRVLHDAVLDLPHIIVPPVKQGP